MLPLIRDRSPKLFSMWEHVLAARICLDRKRSELQEIVRVERESKISRFENLKCENRIIPEN